MTYKRQHLAVVGSTRHRDASLQAGADHPPRWERDLLGVGSPRDGDQPIPDQVLR